jgi:CheY-like chemotaxis protein
LVAEDNDMNRRVAEAILNCMGHRATLAENGLQALEAVESQDFDAVLMDMRMPAMDGLEAARRIRALPPPKGAIPIIAVSANVDRKDAAACREAGMNAVLAKPFGIQQLEALLAPLSRPEEEA